MRYAARHGYILLKITVEKSEKKHIKGQITESKAIFSTRNYVISVSGGIGKRTMLYGAIIR